jgi:F-type H+-transporting ATPase subunit gamma
MKIVASTKLARAQRAMGDSRIYGETSNKVFSNAETKPLEGGKNLIIVCSSDKGLCGGIHSGLTKAVRRKLIENPDTDLVVLGEKSKAQLGRSSAKNIVMSFANVGKDIPSFVEAQTIADQIFQLGKTYDNIEVLYNSFKSAISYEPSTIEAYSEEAIMASGESLFPYSPDCHLPFNDEEFSDVKILCYPRAQNYVDIFRCLPSEIYPSGFTRSGFLCIFNVRR